MKNILDSVKLLLVLMGVGIFGMQPASAVNMNIKIKADVFIPPCKINGGNEDIKVHFDKMSLYEVNGYKNAKTTTVTINCEYYQGTPYIRMDGPLLSGSGDNNVLSTQGTNPSTLGIALYQGSDVNASYPLKIGPGDQGKGYKITRGLTGQNAREGEFTFTAVPYKNGTGTLNAGVFSATATMSIHYV
ncbi:TPA: fimbrial protein [Klebsiella pneumoniae]|nr:fimbrial protein [Klebsiella pneumoniae]